MNIDFAANKTPVEVIKERAFGGTYFRGIYSGVNGKWLKNIDQRHYCSNYYDFSVDKHGAKCGTSLRFWEIMDGLIL